MPHQRSTPRPGHPQRNVPGRQEGGRRRIQRNNRTRRSGVELRAGNCHHTPTTVGPCRPRGSQQQRLVHSDGCLHHGSLSVAPRSASAPRHRRPSHRSKWEGVAAGRAVAPSHLSLGSTWPAPRPTRCQRCRRRSAFSRRHAQRARATLTRSRMVMTTPAYPVLIPAVPGCPWAGQSLPPITRIVGLSPYVVHGSFDLIDGTSLERVGWNPGTGA